jgi:hypothetical protein
MTTRAGSHYSNHPIPPMAPPKWASNNIFKPLDMSRICGFPHNMPNGVDSWLSKFSGNNDTKVDYHLRKFYDDLGSHEVNLQHQDVIMKLFSASLIGDAKAWYDSLPRKSIKTWEDFENAFSKKWGDEKDKALLFSQFDKIQKHEQEPVREFNARFDALVEEFPHNIRPLEGITLVRYLNAFQGKFQFLLKNKYPTTLLEAQEFASQIEANLDSCKLNTPPMISKPIVLEQKVTKLIQSQEALMTKIDALDEEYALYQQDMGNINWESASHKGSCPITKETWDTETMKVAREAKIQLQALISEGLGEEDKPLKEDTHFATPTIPKRDSDELKGTNHDDLASSQSPKDEGTQKGQTEISITSQNPSIEESQVPQDEEDLPIVLHTENLGRKNGKHVPFFISLIVNELILHNCMLDLVLPKYHALEGHGTTWPRNLTTLPKCMWG